MRPLLACCIMFALGACAFPQPRTQEREPLAFEALSRILTQLAPYTLLMPPRGSILAPEGYRSSAPSIGTQTCGISAGLCDAPTAPPAAPLLAEPRKPQPRIQPEWNI